MCGNPKGNDCLMDERVRRATAELGRAELLEKLIDIGTALSSERNRDRLF